MTNKKSASFLAESVVPIVLVVLAFSVCWQCYWALRNGQWLPSSFALVLHLFASEAWLAWKYGWPAMFGPVPLSPTQLKSPIPFLVIGFIYHLCGLFAPLIK